MLNDAYVVFMEYIVATTIIAGTIILVVAIIEFIRKKINQNKDSE